MVNNTLLSKFIKTKDAGTTECAEWDIRTGGDELVLRCALPYGTYIGADTKRIVDDVWLGSGHGESMLGLLSADGGLSDVGVYAGIDRSAVPDWKSNVLENSGYCRDLGLDLMMEMRREIYIASGTKANLIVCSEDIFYSFEALTQYRHRSVGGFLLYLSFDGTPVVLDSTCPPYSMVFLNTLYVEFAQSTGGKLALCVKRPNACGVIKDLLP